MTVRREGEPDYITRDPSDDDDPQDDAWDDPDYLARVIIEEDQIPAEDV